MTISDGEILLDRMIRHLIVDLYAKGASEVLAPIFFKWLLQPGLLTGRYRRWVIDYLVEHFEDIPACYREPSRPDLQ